MHVGEHSDPLGSARVETQWLGLGRALRATVRGGELYEVHRGTIDDDDHDHAHGVPVVSPVTAIRQSIEWGVAGDMVEQAIRRAQAREQIGQRTAARLLVALDDLNSGFRRVVAARRASRRDG